MDYMLQTDPSKSSTIREHGFLIAVEVEDNVNVEAVEFRLKDSLVLMEGVGRCEVTHMGVLESEGE